MRKELARGSGWRQGLEALVGRGRVAGPQKEVERGCHYIGCIRGLRGSPACTLMNVSIQPLNSLWLHTERGLGLLIFCGLGGRQGGLGENGTKEIKKATNANIQLGKMLLNPWLENTKCKWKPLNPRHIGIQCSIWRPLDVYGELNLPTVSGRSNTRINTNAF